MTCIVGLVDKKRVWMGVDSLGVAGYSKTSREDMKLFKCAGVENAMISYTTSFRMGQLLMYGEFFEELEVLKDKINHKYMVTKFVPKIQKAFEDGGFGTIKSGEKVGGSFLVAFRGRLFRVESDYQVGVNSIGYAADGCGADLALGSLHATSSLKILPRERVLMALRAATEFSAGVAPPFHVANTDDCKIETEFDV